MKKIILIFFTVLMTANSFATGFNSNIPGDNPEKNHEIQQQIPLNYQQLKFQTVNFNHAKSKIPINNYRGSDDYMMLYVAGGIVVLTTAFVLLSNNNEYSDGLGEASTGIIIGGSVSAALITTKFFIDRAR